MSAFRHTKVPACREAAGEKGEGGPTEAKQLDVDVLSLRASITLTTEVEFGAFSLKI